MSTLDTQAQTAMQNLLNYDETQLYQQLGMRQKMLETDPAKAGSFDVQLTDEEVSLMGVNDVMADFGKRLYRRWHVEAYKLICGAEGEDEEDRKKLAEAFGTNQMMVGAALAAFLVSNLGLAPVIAAVIAAIAIKRFFRPGYEEFCKVWKKNLPQLDE